MVLYSYIQLSCDTARPVTEKNGDAFQARHVATCRLNFVTMFPSAFLLYTPTVSKLYYRVVKPDPS